MFIFVTLSLCSVYFVVTGIQFWTTAYMITVLKIDKTVVMLSFTGCCITGPLVGVSVGSYLSDANGGYKGKNVLTAIKLCAAFGTMAFIFAFPIGFLGSLYYILPLLWCLLFSGATLIPTATGVVVNSVPKKYMAASSSISQLIFNLGGYFAAPVISAYVMGSFEDKIEGLVWGFRVILWWSIFGILAILGAWIACASQIQKYE